MSKLCVVRVLVNAFRVFVEGGGPAKRCRGAKESERGPDRRGGGGDKKTKIRKKNRKKKLVRE